MKLFAKLKKFFRNLLSLNFYFTVFTIAETVAALGVARLVARAFGIDLNDSPFAYFFLVGSDQLLLPTAYQKAVGLYEKSCRR